MNPAALFARAGEHLAQRLPEAQGAVAHGEHRGAHPPPGGIAQQVGPRLSGLPVAGVHGYQLLAPVGAHAHEHQDARLRLLQAHLEVHTVGPHVDEVGPGQVANLERLVVIDPLGREPGDGGSREPGGRAEELL